MSTPLTRHTPLSVGNELFNGYTGDWIKAAEAEAAMATVTAERDEARNVSAELARALSALSPPVTDDDVEWAERSLKAKPHQKGLP